VIRAAGRGDLPRLGALFARANDAPYDLAAVAEEKCFGAGTSGEPEARVYEDFLGATVTCGKYLRILAVDRAHRRRGIGSALLADAVARGAAVLFAEPGNYFIPGAIEPAFFVRRGWRQTASTQNLETTDLPKALPPGVERATHARRDEILSFIEREFGRIWRFEVTPAFDRDPPTLFVTEDENAITGFAAHDVNNRGLGFGARLLHASLADLRALGHRRAVIPWTDAIGFYEKSCGARVSQRFVTLRR